MSHLFESGFCVRTPSWHQLETLVPDYPGSWDEARELAGLAWDPIEKPVYAVDDRTIRVQTVRSGKGDDADRRQRTTAEIQEIEGWKRIVRSDTNVTLAVTNESYSLIDNSEMGGIVEALLDQKAQWDTAGCLDEGRMTYVCAYLDEPFLVRGDTSQSYPYFVVLNRHDGHGRCKVLPTNVRVVCANTYGASEALGEREGVAYSFAHTKNWRDRIEEAKQAIHGVRDETARWLEICNELTKIRVTAKHRQMFVNEFIPMPPEGVVSERVVRNVELARTAMFGLFGTPTVEPIKDNAYGLVQAAGEYLDHLRGYRNTQTYMGRQLLRPQAAKARALTLAREVVAS